MICPFCKQREAGLLCDGRLEDGRTCNASMCRNCAKKDSQIFGRLSRRDPVTKSRCYHETVDRCPTCVQLDRKTNWGGMSEAQVREVFDEFGRPKPTGRQKSLFGG